MACLFVIGLVAGLVIDRLCGAGRSPSFSASTQHAATANRNQSVYGNETVLLSLKQAVASTNGNREGLHTATPYENETVAIRLLAPGSSAQH